MTAELIAQRGNDLHRRRVILARGKAGKERGRDDRKRYGMIEGGLDCPPPLARVLGKATNTRKIGIFVKCTVEKVE